MSSQLSPALVALLCTACESTTVEPLSDPQDWNGDFMRGARSTENCTTDTIANARNRMYVGGPFTIDQYEQRVAYSFTTKNEPDRVQVVDQKVSDFVRETIGQNESIYEVSFSTDPSGGDYWGFSGYVVARDECVVHVSKMSYSN